MISGQGHDYNLIVNDIPCQVKTVILEEVQTQSRINYVNCYY